MNRLHSIPFVYSVPHLLYPLLCQQIFSTNKVSLEHSHPFISHVVWGCFYHTMMAGLSNCSEDGKYHKAKIIDYLSPCSKKFANPLICAACLLESGLHTGKRNYPSYFRQKGISCRELDTLRALQGAGSSRQETGISRAIHRPDPRGVRT